MDRQDEQAREYGVDAYEEIMMTEKSRPQVSMFREKSKPTAQIVYS